MYGVARLRGGLMKNILVLYAKYNRDTDDEIIKLLSRLSDNELKCERNIFCKSINNLFNHIILGEWYYLNAMLYISGRKYCSDHKERRQVFQRIETSFFEASEIMRELDKNFIDFVDSVTEDDLKLVKKNMKIYNGRVVDISVWEYITQHITHQQHHRGQLSQVLDEIGIIHEFGNIFPYVSDSTKICRGN
ncbi:MAG: hypothetical protein FIA99_19885 [Ruminiclostridium sp.]|nr:hypothetical protein [Ruminiclostridium sp.]